MEPQKLGIMCAMTVWEVRRPPEADEMVAEWIVDDPPELLTLRHALHQAVLRHRSSPLADVSALAERLVLVATELAGNALRHGRPPTVVALLRADGHLIIDVADRDLRSAPTVEVRPLGEGGIGLQLTQRLAEAVGWYPTDAAKHVWAQFRLPSDGPAKP
jgi:serine/threonine-protein kinase RsbW